MIKLIASILALVAAFVFVFIFPGSGFEETAISLAASIAGALGLKSWRENYGVIKQWFESKTVLGALIVVIPLLLLVLAPLFSWVLPEWAVYVATALIVGGGGTLFYGIFDAIKENKKLNE